jgi:hypothetical protein
MRTSAAERACSKPGQAQGSNSWLCGYLHNHEYDS